MKLSQVHVDGFGVWNGLKLVDLSPDCTVIYGPNEAGKTTVLQFIRAVLYGFSPARAGRYLPPLRGGIAGGTLTVNEIGDKEMLIGRQYSASEPLGSVIVEAADGDVFGGNYLQRLLHDVDESTFNNIFAVGLRELQELGTLTDSEAGHWLYSITSGIDRVSLCDVLRELQNSRGRLWLDDRQTGQIANLLDERKSLQNELRQLTDLPQQYERIANQRDDCEREITNCQRVLSECEAKHRTLEAASLVYDTWHRRNGLSAQIEALSTNNSWPENALLRMDRLTAAIKKARGRIRQLKKQRQKLAVEFRAITLNEALWRQSARVAALAENESWIISVEQELGDAESTVKSLADQQQNQQKQLDLTARLNVPTPQLIDAQIWEALKRPAAALSKARRRMKSVQRKTETQRETLEKRKREIDSAMSSVDHRDLDSAVEAAGQRVTQLRRRIQLDDQTEQFDQTRSDLELQIADLHQRQILPKWTVIGLGSIFAVGVVFLLAGLFLPASFTGSLGWPLAIVGLLSIGSAIGGKYAMERSLARQLAESQKQLEQAQVQSQRAEAERAELDQLLPKSDAPLASRLQSAEQELARLEQLLPLNAERQTAEQAANEAAARSEGVSNKYQVALRHWRNMLTNVGIPDRLTPREVRDMAVGGAQLARVEHQLTGARSDLDRRRRELAALANRIEQIFLAAAIKPESTRISEQLRQLRRELADEEARQQRRDLVRRNRRRMRRRQTAIEERILRLRRRRKSLLKDCNVADVPAFRRRAVEASRVAALVDERDAAAREIASLLTGAVLETDVASIVAHQPNEQLALQLAEAHRQLEAARTLQRHLFEHRGQLSEQLRQLAGDRRLAFKRFELGQVEAKLSAAVSRWQVLTITQRLMEDIRADYERNRQPETLREASGYLAKLTQGHYRRVWTPMSEPTLLVDDAHGRPVPVEVLSRGTREQLFLSLRLALVGLFARRGVELPMVLDDVLVNFDTDRAAAAIPVLHDFAHAGHQLLIFTCHEHIARLFKSHRMDVRRLPNNKTSGRDLPFEPPDEPPRLPDRAIFDEPITLKPEPKPKPEPEVQQFELLRVATAHSNDGYLPQMIEVSVQPAVPSSNVDIQYVDRPPIFEEVSPEPPVPTLSQVVKRKRPKLRIDPPQPMIRAYPIRRRWAAEEFSGELDDRINPLWLMNGAVPSRAVENSTFANALEVSETSSQPVAVDGRRIRILKQFDDEPVPVVIEVTAGDEDWDM